MAFITKKNKGHQTRLYYFTFNDFVSNQTRNDKHMVASQCKNKPQIRNID